MKTVYYHKYKREDKGLRVTAHVGWAYKPHTLECQNSSKATAWILVHDASSEVPASKRLLFAISNDNDYDNSNDI